ncbi:putative late blight resistance protein homolog R1B-16 isoform X1 [Henckelia pumila]|uniref:putative late blight resistance protein homolog R1B-16 isoform X1 n=1 Tax=Henckelia pumila TaxID=405737 RepID=UPI003C6DDC67
MAAYASLLSLGNILDHLLQHPPRQGGVLEKAQIDSLLENITFLQEFLEEFSLTRGDEIQALEAKIVSSAHAAENIIESRVVDQILEDSEDGSERSSSTDLLCQDLQTVIEEFGSLKKDVMKIKETDHELIEILQQPRKDGTAGSFIRGASINKNTMVGFDEDLIQIMDTLTGDPSNLQFLSILGMGGIGKTTLAKNVFDNPLIVKRFDRRAWVTISQQYRVHEILLGLLKNIGVHVGEDEEKTQNNDDELGLRLHRCLFGRRYFIVMDDMWSIEVWYVMKRFFPDNGNGSRVMVTTRLSNVADSFNSCILHRLHFLDEDQSWALFCDKVFGKESCPPELEQVAKTIARNCGGLPLAIVAVSGLVAKFSRTIEYWVYVANHTYEALDTGSGELCFHILSLSYRHLPVHLKPCFLYLAIFPEDHKIKISRLVKLWVAEGILKPIGSRSLEESAEDNLKDLIDRNMIQVHDYGSRNKIKTCTIHDLFRDLCLREAQKEKFLCVTKFHSLSYHSRIIDSKIRDEEELKSLFANLLLKPISYLFSNDGFRRLVKSRYIDCDSGIFSSTLDSLSVVWNLQTIMIPGVNLSQTPMNLPAEIWEMPHLRHLKKDEGDFYLPDPPSTKTVVLKNLQTLYKIRNLRCTDEVVGRIPNIRKLGITYREFPDGLGWDDYEVDNLARLHSLESLFLKSAEKVPQQSLCFPHSLKKLTLENCELGWEDLTVVGLLPHLEVLNLMHDAVKGSRWNPEEGEFLELKCLRIQSTDVEEWIADRSHFPRLEKLQLGGLRHLKEIPQGIGEIPTLGSILLVWCSPSAIYSAKKIQEEQQNIGNYELEVRFFVQRLARRHEYDTPVTAGWWKR